MLLEENVKTLSELEDKIKNIRKIIGEVEDLNIDINLSKQMILFDKNGTYMARIQFEKVKGFI